MLKMSGLPGASQGIRQRFDAEGCFMVIDRGLKPLNPNDSRRDNGHLVSEGRVEL
ncbi:hypothetical protein IVB56_13075 [Bradyrhizobium sp. CW7]|uniref:hypothetical protein n=1 Tax=Bradyrhizobium sp. CW7 TaxID=2782688 RepID=UPI001FF8374D|nr:hypothetical protein [Bradyrhizobium sp. CW7]MCK1352009.1 hypothetical protein [Bradyrhizobium sp. CW7]